jgi:hypothetical protein
MLGRLSLPPLLSEFSLSDEFKFLLLELEDGELLADFP